VQEYVLPDFSAKSQSRMGHIRSGPNAVVPPAQPKDAEDADNADKDQEKEKGKEKASARRRQGEEEEQVLWMGNERFAGNELLFHPPDIGEPFLMC
jgi:actin-related protein 6